METAHPHELDNSGLALEPESLWRTEQLRRAGFGAASVQRLTHEGKLVRLRRGCYIDARLWNGLNRRDQEIQQIMAHAHALGGRPSGVYSHVSAARLHGLFLWNVPFRIHVTQQARKSTSKGAADVRRHFRHLPPGEKTIVRLLPVTTLERTVIDCAASLPYRQAMIIADHAARMGVQPETLREMVEAMSGMRGVRNVRCVIEDLNPLSESPGETLTRILLMNAGISMPQLQVQVSTRRGSHRLDFGWPELKVALEFDGNTKYFDYAPTGEVLLAERKREAALMEDGWSFIRLDWNDLFRPAEVERRIKTALHQASSKAA